VTTILDKGLPKPALMYWMGKSVAEYAVANHRQLSAMLDAVTLRRSDDGTLRGIVSDPTAVEGAIDWLKGAPHRQREKRANIGSAVHGEVEAIILDTPRPAEWPDELAPYRSGWEAFVADFQPEFLMSEATVWNRTEHYAGTLDWFAKIGHKIVLGDTKTGKDVYPEAGLQLSAYAHAEFVLLPDGSEEPLPAIDGAVVLHLTETGYRLIPVHLTDALWDAFRYVREVMRFAEEIAPDVLGEPLGGPAGLDWLYAEAAA